MKKILVAATALLLLSALKLSAQTEAEQKALMDFMTPGDMHKMLVKFDGKWKGETTMWMQPGAPAEKMEGVMENKMILGGRYQQSTYKSSFMGMPFEGQSTMGWDNGRKIFVNTWIDNMGTGLIFLEGTWDAATKTINFSGKQTDPMTGKEMAILETYKIVDDNTHVMTMYGPGGSDGNEFKMMEIKYTRGK